MSLKSYVFAGAAALVAAALVLTVTPVSANVTEAAVPPDAVDQIIHLGTYYVETGELVPPSEGHVPSVTLEYEARVASGFFSSVGNTTEEKMNRLELPVGSYIRQIEIGFATDATTSVSLSQAFYTTDDLIPPAVAVAQTINGTDAVYNVTVGGLIGGGIIGYTVILDFGDSGFIVPQAEMETGTVYTSTGDSMIACGGGVNPCTGPLLAGPGPGPAPGAQDLWDEFDPAAWLGGTYIGSFFFGGFPPATFWYAVFSGSPSVTRVPTLSGIGLAVLVALLLGVATLLMRRRRQQS